MPLTDFDTVITAVVSGFLIQKNKMRWVKRDMQVEGVAH